jgi:predicted nucleic acid-binding protein
MSDVVVVDASLALKWVLDEPDSQTAVILLDQWTDEGMSVIAPALITHEVTNTLYRQVVAGKLAYEEAKQGLTELFSIGVLLKFSLYEDISTQAMEFAHQLNLPATYDAHYLATTPCKAQDCINYTTCCFPVSQQESSNFVFQEIRPQKPATKALIIPRVYAKVVGSLRSLSHCLPFSFSCTMKQHPKRDALTDS